MSNDEKKLVVVDLMPILYRGYFVFLNRPRKTSTGINTSSLSVFASTLTQMLREWKPDYLAIAMESLSPTFRHQIYPEYKAQRDKMPEDIATGIQQAIELATAMDIPMIRAEGFEADDVLGTLATRGAAENLDVIIVSPDKDLGQLVGPRVKLFRPGEDKFLDEAAVCEHWSIPSPSSMIDLLAMAGDASDNIPGLAGVGPKTATKLLADYGSIDNMLAHATEIKGKLGDKIRASGETLQLSRKLVTIVRDIPLDITWEQLRVTEPVAQKVIPVLLKYELATMMKRLKLDASYVSASPDDLFACPQSASQGDTSTNTPAQAQESAQPKAPTYQTLQDVPHTYTFVHTAEGVAELAKTLGGVTHFAVDTETMGLTPRIDPMVGCSFATQAGIAWYVAVPHDKDEAKAFLAPLAPILADEKIAKIGHNLKFDRAAFDRIGLPLCGPLHDTLLAHYLLAVEDHHDMDTLARKYLQYDPIPITTLIGKDKASNMGEIEPAEICDYAAEDADVTLRLYDALMPLIKDAGLDKLLETCEEPLAGVLLQMEETGVKIDTSALRTFRQSLDRELLKLELGIRDIVGAGVNLASPKQMGEVLFGSLIPDAPIKRTPRGQFPTDEATLLKVRDRHPVIDMLLDWRACTKLKNTYTDKLPEHIDPEDGRIHTTFNQSFTDTGRLSSSNPNLQNIPIRTERGQRIRAAFVSRGPGWKILSADYSQVELRLMAAMSGDQQMIDAFNRGEDIHAQTASVVYGVPLAEVTSQQRSHCKMVNFGIIYGISAFGLSERLRIARKDAAELIDAYFLHYPTVKSYMEKTIAEAKEKGFAQTLFGRRRALPDLSSRSAVTRAAAERIAINMPIQGTAADIIKFAMVAIQRELKSRGMRTEMTLQIHDELLFDVPDDELDEATKLIRNAMENVYSLPVPLLVSIGSGPDWLSAH